MAYGHNKKCFVVRLKSREQVVEEMQKFLKMKGIRTTEINILYLAEMEMVQNNTDKAD